MVTFSKGFTGGRRADANNPDLPPRQYLSDDFPGLSAGRHHEYPLRTSMNHAVPDFLDGNAMVGALSEIFAFEVTAALGQCASRRSSARLTETNVYTSAPGVVVRCPGCGAVLPRYMNADGQIWLDMHGLTYLHVEQPRLEKPR